MRERGELPEGTVEWIQQRLGVQVVGLGARSGHLSQVVRAGLQDGRVVMVKVRPWERRLPTCGLVQRRLAEVGYACPRPLTAVERVGGSAVHVEEDVSGGSLWPSGEDPAMEFASALRSLVLCTPQIEAGSLRELGRSAPPWVGWSHDGAGLWPGRDTPGPKLRTGEGPGWIEEVGRRVRAVLLQSVGEPLVCGHGDWEAQNLRWQDGSLFVAHDWDSLTAQPEAAVVGAAAAVWPAGVNGRHAAGVEETETFLDAYQQAAGVRWTARSVRLAWAAGLWVRAFNAKKDATDGVGVQVDLLHDELDERRHRAGV